MIRRKHGGRGFLPPRRFRSLRYETALMVTVTVIPDDLPGVVDVFGFSVDRAWIVDGRRVGNVGRKYSISLAQAPFHPPPRHCEERSDAAIHAAVQSSETPKQAARPSELPQACGPSQ